MAPERRPLDNLRNIVAVIDDDPSMRRSVERLVNANGYPTEGFASAEAFLSHAQISTLRCIVLDIHLGGMSGIELWHQLTHVDIKLPVIFITAVDDEVMAREAIKAGCIAYLKKPFSAEVLINAIKSAGQRSCAI